MSLSTPKLRLYSNILAPIIALIFAKVIAGVPASQTMLTELGNGPWLGKFAVVLGLIAVTYWWMALAHRLGVLFNHVIPESIKPIPDVFLWIAGTGFLAFIVLAIAHAQILNFPAMVILTIVLSMVPVNPSRMRFFAYAPFFRMTESSLLFALIAIYAIPKWIESFLPNGQGDPLYYHAYSAWQWAQAGGFQFDPWFPWFLQGGMMEYLFAAFGVILNDPLALLIASQILHATVSILFGGLAVYQISKLFVRDRIWSLIAVLVFLTIARDPLVVIRAKNDGFIGIFGLAACYGFFRYVLSKDVQWLLLLTIYAAMALITKHTALFILIPLGGILLLHLSWQRRTDDLKTLTRYSLIVLPFALLVMIRNFALSGSPVFPAMTHISFFRSPLINDEIAATAARYVGSNNPFWPEFLTAFRSFSASKPFFAFSFLSMFLFRKNVFGLLITLTISIMAISAQLAGGDPISDRFAITLLGLFAVCGVFTFEKFEVYLVNKGWQYVRPAFIFGALGAALFNSGVEVPAARFLKRTIPFATNHQTFFSYVASERSFLTLSHWINKNYSHGKILCTFSGEGLLLNIPIIHNDSEIRANAIVNSANVNDLVSGMEKYGFTLFLKQRDGNAFERHRPYYANLSDRLKLVHTEGELELYEIQ